MHLTRFSIRNPFYGHFLTGLPVLQSDGVPDIGLGGGEGGRLTLFFNPGFWSTLPVGSPVAERLLKHEVLHLLFGHFDRGLDFPNRRLFFLATDLVVNQYTGEEPGADGEITLACFPDLNLAPNQEVGYYYERLKRTWETLLNRAKLLGEPAVSTHPYLPFFLMDHPAMARHRYWPGPEQSRMTGLFVMARLDQWRKSGLDPALAELPFPIRTLLNRSNQDFASGINWKNVLRKFATTSRTTRLRDTLHRPSKRYGRPPGLKLRRKSRLVVAVDISGSVSPALVQVFFQEIRRIWRIGAEVEVVEFDSAIRKKYPFAGAVPLSVTGRGNTDFNPPVETANREKRVDGLILLTDGLGSPPDILPAMPALWIIADGKDRGLSTTKFPGRVINMVIPSTMV